MTDEQRTDNGGELVEVEVRGPVHDLRLNRSAQLNALSLDLLEALRSGLQQAEADPGCRAVTLSGTSRVFSAGVDIEEARTVSGVADAISYLLRVRSFFAFVRDFPKPTVAVMAGSAFGGGLELALCCDFRVAADDIEMGLPELTIGAMPSGGGIAHLAGIVGSARAKELVLLGERISANKAAEIGLVTVAIDRASLDEYATQLAQRLADRPGAVYALAKAALDGVDGADPRTADLIEYLATVAVFGTDDRREGMQAFLAKRSPEFTGR